MVTTNNSPAVRTQETWDKCLHVPSQAVILIFPSGTFNNNAQKEVEMKLRYLDKFLLNIIKRKIDFKK